MKNKWFFIGFIVILAAYIIFYRSTHHLLYGSICGSGLNGLKLLLTLYIPIILLLLLLYLMFRDNKKAVKKRCKNCKLSFNKNLRICPYCGTNTEGDE